MYPVPLKRILIQSFYDAVRDTLPDSWHLNKGKWHSHLFMDPKDSDLDTLRFWYEATPTDVTRKNFSLALCAGSSAHNSFDIHTKDICLQRIIRDLPDDEVFLAEDAACEFIINLGRGRISEGYKLAPEQPFLRSHASLFNPKKYCAPVAVI